MCVAVIWYDIIKMDFKIDLVGNDFDIQRWMKLSQGLFSMENFYFSNLGSLHSTTTVFDSFDVS